MLEYWNNGLKTHNFCVWIKGFGINSYEFSMNVLIGSGDNYSFVAIMTFPNEWLSLFDGEKPLKAQNTTSWNTPYVTTKCTLAADPFEWYPHGVRFASLTE
jgi:hypothetical protein